jgi:hypothetical protein
MRAGAVTAKHLDTAQMRINIADLAGAATPADTIGGLEWYPMAFAHCRAMAWKYGTTTEVAAAVLAALSPRCRWTRNLRDAHQVLAAVQAGRGPDTVRVQTFNRNKEKAFAIARSGDTSLLTGTKITDFYAAIMARGKSAAVVDSHAFNAALGERQIIGTTSPTITNKKYGVVQEAFADIAGALGIWPAELQAICWLAWQTKLHDEGARGIWQ